jgi:hypothetical protein
MCLTQAYINYGTDCFMTSRTQVEKQKLESVENIPAFLRRSDIGQFVTCDELILPWPRRGGGSKSRLARSRLRDGWTLRA